MSTSVNFSCIPRTLHQLSVCLLNILENFHAAARPSVNFCQLSVHLRNLPSTFCASAELISNSVSFLCFRGLFEKFRTAVGSSVNTSQLSVRLRDFPSAFCASTGHSFNFRQHFMRPKDYPLTFRVSAGHSVNFSELPCGRGIFCQLSVHLQDLPSIFGVSAEISVNFHQLSVRPRDLLSTFRAFVGPSVDFR